MRVLRSVMRFTEPENASDTSGIPNGILVLPQDGKATDDVLDQRLRPQAERQARHPHANQQAIISTPAVLNSINRADDTISALDRRDGPSQCQFAYWPLPPAAEPGCFVAA